MERILHDLTQGTPEWDQFRLEHNGASEAAAMLGLSKNTTRTALLDIKHTGLAKEFSEWVQKNILDHGHKVEASARTIVEGIIGEDLYPVVYSYGKESASCDGLTMDGATVFEHKQWAAALAESVKAGILPEEHQPQCQQVMYVTGAEKVIFTVSDGTPDRFVHMEVFPDQEWVKRILAGWIQFGEDLKNHKPVQYAAAPVAEPIKQLPALHIELSGSVMSSNLVTFKETALAMIQGINTNLQTDQDFANAKSMVTFCEKAEAELETVKKLALAKTESIDELFRTLDQLREEMRQKRLTLDKLVTKREGEIRSEIADRGKSEFARHIEALNTRLGKPYMPVVPTDFAAAIKGKRTVASLNNAVDTELARAKIAASAIADNIDANLKHLRDNANEFASLFPDTKDIVVKPHDDLVTLVTARIATHKENERVKAEKVESDRKAAEAADAEKKRLAELQTTPAATPVAEAVPAPALAPVVTAAPPAAAKPADDLIRAVVEMMQTMTKAEQLQVLNAAIAVTTKRSKAA